MTLPKPRTSETKFREAFERLKSGMTQILPKAALVSQNNVAKEASCDPSALRKSRFPILVAEIQTYLSAQQHDQSPLNRRHLILRRQRSRDSQKMIIDLRRQRDFSASLLVEATARTSLLTLKVRDLEARLEALQAKPSISQLSQVKPRARPSAADTD